MWISTFRFKGMWISTFRSKNYIESAALNSPVPFNTHDHHFKECKNFISTHLMELFTDLIGDELCGLLYKCVYFTASSELSSSNLESTYDQSKTFYMGACVLLDTKQYNACPIKTSGVRSEYETCGAPGTISVLMNKISMV
ncbi:hypothetical protein PSTT_12025 [Puccinia striiformis]|nr:hypothetical protein PSTT_12025 [Puccinia striiformis]